MINLLLDFKKEEWKVQGNESSSSPTFSVPERAFLYQALARLKKVLPEKLNERIIVEVNGSSVKIERQGAEMSLHPKKIMLMLDEVRKQLSRR